MATSTGGTSANNSLPFGMAFQHGNPAADFAKVSESILNDLNPTHPIQPGSWSQNGLLYIPRRGVVKVFEGDWVFVDNLGWPIVVSKNSITSGSTVWVHSP